MYRFFFNVHYVLGGDDPPQQCLRFDAFKEGVSNWWSTEALKVEKGRSKKRARNIEEEQWKAADLSDLAMQIY